MNKYQEYVNDLKRTAPKNTVSSYSRKVKSFLDYIGDKEINKKSITEYLDTIDGKFSTVNSYKSAISNYCEFIQMETNPTHGIKLKRDSKNPEIKLMTEDYFEKLVNHTDIEIIEERRLRYRLIFTMAQKCGMRISEILELLVSDIDNESIIIRDTKNGTTRRIPISSDLSILIQEYIEESENKDKLFEVKYSVVRKRLERYCKELNIPYGRYNGITMHSARHSKATELVVKKNMSTTLVAKYLGNSPQTLEKYLHPTFEDMKDLI